MGGGLKFRQINRSTRPSIGGERYSSLTLPYAGCVTLSPPSSLFQALKILLVTIIIVGNTPLSLLLLSSQLLDCPRLCQPTQLEMLAQVTLVRSFVPLCQAHRTEQNRQTNLKELVEKIFTFFFVCTLAPKLTFEITDLSGL